MCELRVYRAATLISLIRKCDNIFVSGGNQKAVMLAAHVDESEHSPRSRIVSMGEAIGNHLHRASRKRPNSASNFRWYNVSGTARYKMKGKSHPRRLKARAIAALIVGESPASVADRLRLPRESVRNWKLALSAEKLAEVSRDSAGRFNEVVCDNVEATLRSLSAQAVAISDPEYLRQQSARDIAALHGGIADHALLMLDRLNLQGTVE